SQPSRDSGSTATRASPRLRRSLRLRPPVRSSRPARRSMIVGRVSHTSHHLPLSSCSLRWGIVVPLVLGDRFGSASDAGRFGPRRRRSLIRSGIREVVLVIWIILATSPTLEHTIGGGRDDRKSRE